MLPKNTTTENHDHLKEATLKMVDQLKPSFKNKEKKLKSKKKSILKELAENKNENDSEGDDALTTPLQYDMPKPGPHAKVI